MTVRLQVLRLDPEAPLPRAQHPGDAGLDLCAMEEAVVEPGARVSIGTGVAVAIPGGYAGLVVPRSGLAARHGVSLVNTPGLIDSGYRGEVRLLLVNHDLEEPFKVRRGERLAQLVLVAVPDVAVEEALTLPESARGAGGFGSTGR